MASKFLATFNIVDGVSKDYQDVLEAVHAKHRFGDISEFIRLDSLSTTYLIKSNLTATQLSQAFSKFITKRTHVIVVKYIDDNWNLLPKDSNHLNKNNY